MTGTKEKFFLFGTDAGVCAGRAQKIGFYAWNIGMLIMSAAGICTLTLMLGVGNVGKPLFFDYLGHPLVFFLNFLPIFLFELLIYCLANRSWIAFLVSSLVFVTAGVGNYFKLMFRDDPFMFSDISAIHTALGVSSNYNITLTKRIVICLACVIIGTLLLFFLVRGSIGGRARAITALAVILSIWPLWKTVYTSSDIYDVRTENFEHANRWTANDVYCSKGFVYPFIYSIRTTMDLPPDGYDETEAEAALAAYSDSDIPKDKRVNIVAIQLEAFSDFTLLGLEGIEDIYAPYHELERESYAGDLVTNIFGGGTIDTERCFLTGYTQLKDYRQNTNSYVWYLREQGYTANGSHPCLRGFYNRYNVNRYLGFEDYLFTEQYYEKYSYPFALDNNLFPEILAHFKSDVASGKDVFSFNVTYQGHGPYYSEGLAYDEPFWNGDVSDYSYYVVNNYLGSVKDTIERLCELKDELEAMQEPVVLLVYGDHMPWLGDNNTAYTELGVNLDTSTLDGFLNYYSTRYLMWANSAAKAVAGNDFVGEGPMISPCYLMSELFAQLGWEGPAYMKFMNDIQKDLPVINTNGYYILDGKVANSLSGALLDENSAVNAEQYYMRRSFMYREVAS